MTISVKQKENRLKKIKLDLKTCEIIIKELIIPVIRVLDWEEKECGTKNVCEKNLQKSPQIWQRYKSIDWRKLVNPSKYKSPKNPRQEIAYETYKN